MRRKSRWIAVAKCSLTYSLSFVWITVGLIIGPEVAAIAQVSPPQDRQPLPPIDWFPGSGVELNRLWRSRRESTSGIEAPVQQVQLVVRLSQRRVFVYRDQQEMASYPIAIGRAGWETPIGQYRVLNMEKDPVFKSFKTGRIIPPGPDNPLGVRWIGIWTDGRTQLGFHGTNEEELIGQAVSHGCIRMRNADVIDLYEKVQIGTPVVVEP